MIMEYLLIYQIAYFNKKMIEINKCYYETNSLIVTILIWLHHYKAW